MVSEGVIEITLLGQNVNSYGKDLKKKINFPVLLDKLSNQLRKYPFLRKENILSRHASSRTGPPPASKTESR